MCNNRTSLHTGKKTPTLVIPTDFLCFMANSCLMDFGVLWKNMCHIYWRVVAGMERFGRKLLCHASLEEKDQVSGGVSFLCCLAASVPNVLFKPPGIR